MMLVRDFWDTNTVAKKGGDKPKAEVKKIKPCVPSIKKQLRI